MKLSIATPTFGKPKYLQQTIDSVCDQTIPTAHFVCGGNLTFEPKAGNTCVTIIKKDPDPGMVSCWNTAALAAETEYVAFLADDNTLQPNYSEVMVGFLEAHPECELVFCNQNHMDSAGKFDKEKAKYITDFFGRSELKEGLVAPEHYEMLLKKNSVPLEACVIRKSVLNFFGIFKDEAKGTFDQEFLYRMLIRGVKVGFVPQYLMNFRWHDDAYCATHREEHIIGGIWTNESLMKLSDKYYNFFKEKNVDLKGRLLRYKLKPSERLNLMFELMKEKNGLKSVVKNTVAKMIGKK